MKINVIAREYDEDGNLVKEQGGHNAICVGDPDPTGGNSENGLVYALIRMFDVAGTYATRYTNTDFISDMELGTGTPSNDGLGSPYSSFSTVESIDIDSSSLDESSLTAPFITLSTTWDSTYGAISGVTEAVLLTESGQAFAYKAITPALSKTSAGTLVIEWKITLS